MDLVLNNLQRLICQKTEPNQTKQNRGGVTDVRYLSKLVQTPAALLSSLSN